MNFEKSKRLPFAEQTELAILRKLKRSVVWLSEQSFVPSGIRQLLSRALGGEELAVTKGSIQREQIPKKPSEIAI
ncbi:MAG: hypothetical protein K6G27_02795 [Lachnospiraceae bacterium]|nr:hypothetical protein [Lachnospiraceae bacterium]